GAIPNMIRHFPSLRPLAARLCGGRWTATSSQTLPSRPFVTMNTFVSDASNKPIDPTSPSTRPPPSLTQAGAAIAALSGDTANLASPEALATAEQQDSNTSPANDQLEGASPSFADLNRHVGKHYGRELVNILESREVERHHVLHVHANLNNTILSLTDSMGQVLINASGGSAGFKKSKRAGFEAAYQATNQIVEKTKSKGIVIDSLHIKFKGLGQGRDAAFKAVRALTNWRIDRLSDCTPIPFNGCRPKKQRRL
ncbi:hypothetical protein H4R35_006178, partial [Dimargaris xerosporica]